MLVLTREPAQPEPARQAAAVPVERRLDQYARRWRAMCLPTDPPPSSVVRLQPERES